MKLRLGINCGFAINRYIEPEEWTKIVGKKLGLRYVQFVADLLNPFLPEDYINNQLKRIISSCKKIKSLSSNHLPAYIQESII